VRQRIAESGFETKASGGAALEIADLVVTPLGRWVAGMQARLDLDVVMSKPRRGPAGDRKGAGLVVLPRNSACGSSHLPVNGAYSHGTHAHGSGRWPTRQISLSADVR